MEDGKYKISLGSLVDEINSACGMCKSHVIIVDGNPEEALRIFRELDGRIPHYITFRKEKMPGPSHYRCGPYYIELDKITVV
ncbi:hypothetical protein COU59_03845 [Candidatus Pacearchaeota archaeon CG10_big_fil_rev_8_21_14_0_10_34_12]|nr:MAG: hypothetical protein COU59_03845 [Candidatus Pacearchaeota archaeon CG10_big_fil_rev_8_21_14_0_10_34_12]